MKSILFWAGVGMCESNGGSREKNAVDTFIKFANETKMKYSEMPYSLGYKGFYEKYKLNKRLYDELKLSRIK